MSRKTKAMFFAVLAALIVSAACLVAPQTAYASSFATKASGGAHAYTLGTGTYHLDANGDRKADTIKVSAKDIGFGAYGKLIITVNGKTVFSKKTNFFELKLQLLQMRNGKCFFFIYLPVDNGDAEIFGIYKSSGGKLKQVVDGNRVLGKRYGTHRSGYIARISGNSIWLDYSLMSWSLGGIGTVCKYNYKNGTLKKSANVTKFLSVDGPISKTLKTMKAYKTPKCKSAKFTIKKGKKVKFLGIYSKAGVVSVKIKVGAKTGWLKLAQKYGSSLMYKYEYVKGFFAYVPPFEGRLMAG